MNTITQDHCQSCGETSREYVSQTSSYSSCCNERIISVPQGVECDARECSHS